MHRFPTLQFFQACMVFPRSNFSKHAWLIETHPNHGAMLEHLGDGNALWLYRFIAAIAPLLALLAPALPGLFVGVGV
jgi:hypothetical protein